MLQPDRARARRLLNVDAARRAARRGLPRVVFDYVDGGSGDERTLADNRRAFTEVMLRPRAGFPPGQPDLATTVLGTPLNHPVLLAPCGMMGTVHPDGEAAVARVAERQGTIAVFSTYSSQTLESIAAASAGPKWFQLYFLGGRPGAEWLIDRAVRSEYDALVVTLDTNVPATRERDVRNGVRFPILLNVSTAARFGPQALLRPRWLARFARAGFPLEIANARPVAGDSPRLDQSTTLLDSAPGWDDLAWIRDRWGGRLVVKGLLTADDTRRAIDAGADAVVVSNHGGRQLDGVPGTLRALPDVVAAAGDRVEVLLDSGVRRGSDVVKALALGARAVLVGRPYLYGLGAAGEAGVERILDLFAAEIVETLQLLGCASVRDLDPTWLWNAGQGASS